MSARFFNGYKTSDSAAAADESASARFSSACNAMLLVPDTVIAVSVFVIIGILFGSLGGIISIIISAVGLVSLILIILVVLESQFNRRPKPLEAI